MRVIEGQSLYHKPDTECLSNKVLQASPVDNKENHKTHITVKENRDSLCPNCFPEESTVEP